MPMVESMVALVLVDHLMMQYAQCNLLGRDDYSDLVQGNMKTLYDPAFIGGDGDGGRCPPRTCPPPSPRTDQTIDSESSVSGFGF